MAGSNPQGTFVAPSTRIPVSLLPTPCICTRNSVLIRRLLSFSPSPRDEQRESTSSMKIIAGALRRANSNRERTKRSLSPWYLETKSEDDTDRKQDAPASVATAFAKK